MIRFKEKVYAKPGGTWNTIKNNWAAVSTNPMTYITGAGSVAGIAGYRMNKRRIEQADAQHKEVMRQNERLIRALGGVEKGLNNIQQPMAASQQGKDTSWLKIGGHKIFSAKEKSYGMVTSSMIDGAAIGAALSAPVALFVPGKNKKALMPLFGAGLGALAGSVWGITKTLDQRISQGMTGHKLVVEVIKNLERAGYKRNQDFVTDPKRATLMKTKVCIVMSRKADETGLLINTVNDPKLKSVSEVAFRKLPKDAQRVEKVSDRFNDIQVSSFPKSDDPVYIFSIIEEFIKGGFPVYLMEVG